MLCSVTVRICVMISVTRSGIGAEVLSRPRAQSIAVLSRPDNVGVSESERYSTSAEVIDVTLAPPSDMQCTK